MDELSIGDDEYLDRWKPCLAHEPRVLWKQMVEDHEFNEDAEGMKLAITTFIGILNTDPDPKGTILRAFYDRKFSKPMDNTELEYYRRITRLLRYIEIVPGEQVADLTSYNSEEAVLLLRTQHPVLERCILCFCQRL